MEYGAIDLHKQHSVIRIIDEAGAVVVERRVTTSREGLERVFAERPALRVLLESGTASEWVAQTVEAWGHEVIVADPNYALMYGARARAVKTDRRDVAALAEACRRGIYRRAHRVSAAQRARRREVRVREQLVRIRHAAHQSVTGAAATRGVSVAGGGRGKRAPTVCDAGGAHAARGEPGARGDGA